MNPGKKRDVVIQVFDNILLQYLMKNSFSVSADNERDIALRRGAFLSLISEEGSLSYVIKISDDCLAKKVERRNSNGVEISDGISK